MIKIRLMRIGAKKRPFYRVVVVDERAKRNGAYLELLGTYNPLTTPHEILLKKDRIEYWLKMGAVKSDGFLRIIGEAPQRPPRKAKKSHAAEAPLDEEKKVAVVADSASVATSAKEASSGEPKEAPAAQAPATEPEQGAQTPTEAPTEEAPTEEQKTEEPATEVVTEEAAPVEESTQEPEAATEEQPQEVAETPAEAK